MFLHRSTIITTMLSEKSVRSLLRSLGLFSDTEQEIRLLVLHTSVAPAGRVVYFAFWGREEQPRWVVKSRPCQAFGYNLLAEGQAIDRITERLAGTSLVQTLPRVLFAGEYDQSVVLVETYQRGTQYFPGTMTSELESTRRYLRQVAGWLSAFKAHTRLTGVSSSEIAAHLRQSLDQFAANYPLLEFERAYLAHMAQDIQELSRHIHLCAVHGDFAFNNVRMNGRDLSVVDWEFYSDSGLCAVDPAFWAGALICFWLGLPAADLMEAPHHDAELRAGWTILQTHFLQPYAAAVGIPTAILEQAVPFGLVTAAMKQLLAYGFHSTGDEIARLMVRFLARQSTLPVERPRR